MALRTILLLAILLPSIPLCFFRPIFGLILWTVVEFTSVQWYLYGANLLPVAMMIAIPTLLGTLVFGRGWRNLLSMEFGLLLVLWVWFTITAIAADGNTLFADHVPDMWLKWQYVSKVVLMTGASAVVIDSFSRLRVLVVTIAASIGVFILKTIPWLFVTAGADRVYGPENSMIGDNNDFGLALNMTLPLFFFLAQTESRLWVKRLFGVLFLLTIPVILFTYSRGALLGLLAVLALMFLRLKSKIILIPVLVGAAIVALLLAPPKWRQRMDFANQEWMDASALSRINAWTFSWNLAKDYPLTGGGFETFTPQLFERYAANPADVHGPHSIYFGVLAEHGFPGLFLYLVLVGGCFVSAHRTLRWARAHDDWISECYANMFRLALMGFLVSGLFLGRAYFDYYFTLIACIAILRRVSKDDTVESEQVEQLQTTETIA